MKVLIDFKKYIIENNNKKLEIMFKVNGIYQNDNIKFIDNDLAMNNISIMFDEIVVERKSEINTHMVFKNKKKTKFLMSASFGRLELDIYTNKLCINKDSIYVLYNVIEDFNSYKTYELHIAFTPIK